MRTFFSNEDMAKLLIDVYNQSDIEVGITIEETGEHIETTAVSYLDVQFYTWWEHVKTMLEENIDIGANLRETWKDSLEKSIGKSYALIEQLDEETISSQDISGATISGRITFLVDANKIDVLEEYMRHIKSKYTGNPIKCETLNGEMVVGYLTLGILLYDQEPMQAQNGEVIAVTLNWKFNYLEVAGTYGDVKLEISLDGDVDANYKEMPIIKYTWQNIFTKESVPTAERVDLAGFIVKAISLGVTISFYDFEKELTNAINSVFWRLGAIKKNGIVLPKQDVNIPIYLKATIGEDDYTYKCVLTDMQKVFSNNEFTISSITLNGWGKVGA